MKVIDEYTYERLVEEDKRRREYEHYAEYQCRAARAANRRARNSKSRNRVGIQSGISDFTR